MTLYQPTSILKEDNNTQAIGVAADFSRRTAFHVYFLYLRISSGVVFKRSIIAAVIYYICLGESDAIEFPADWSFWPSARAVRKLFACPRETCRFRTLISASGCEDSCGAESYFLFTLTIFSFFNRLFAVTLHLVVRKVKKEIRDADNNNVLPISVLMWDARLTKQRIFPRFVVIMSTRK